MTRKTLKIMRPDEALSHYNALVAKRFEVADDMDHAAFLAPKRVAKRLRRLADQQREKAERFAKPQNFHREAAREKREKYGHGVAAAYLRAHGWPMDDAYDVLFNDK